MTQQSSNFPPLDNVLRIYFQCLESMKCSNDILDVGKNLVNNLKRENTPADMIFKELMTLFPDAGCPLARYTTVNHGYMAARCSEHAVRREANQVASRADAEFDNKRQCLEAEWKARCEQTLATNLTTPPATKNAGQKDSQSSIKPGQYVLVLQDLLPGKFSHGGEAWVQAVHGTGGSIVCDVEYTKNAAGNKTRSEKAVPLFRLTLKNCPWHEAQLLSNKRGSKRQQQTTTQQQHRLKKIRSQRIRSP
ncbi:hypothetical protein MHU86_5133 [Fragilaria crotonensis]|nr:hypothetical protein MHU86_5133 [Fragilaria crotonensis]